MNRRGLSLVELLVVITIVGILAGLIVPAVLSVYRSSKQTKIILQVKQLDMACEAFKDRMGFYPTDFYFDHPEHGAGHVKQIDPNLTNSKLLPLLRAEYSFVLNKISPNHREFESHPNFGGDAPIIHWYRQVGRYLNPTNALSFWLGGGVSKNKSLPFSSRLVGSRGRLGEPIEVQNSNELRNESLYFIFYDFEKHLDRDPYNYIDEGGRSDVGTHDHWAEGDNRLETPMQVSNRQPIIYFSDSRSNTVRMLKPYESGRVKEVYVGGDVGFVRPIYTQSTPSSKRQYFNSGKYQIIAPGLDGVVSGGRLGGDFSPSGGLTTNDLRNVQRDDIANFSNGPVSSLE